MHKFVFDDLATVVAACEQLADDMVAFDFRTQPDFIITTRTEIPKRTHQWLIKVTNSVLN
jgi:hypothetical protein